MPKSLRAVLRPKSQFSVNGSLWVECDGERFFGPGPVELLERISESGSISKAAKEMSLSYKKAWSMINRMNNSAIVPLVRTSPGGKEGGGSTVSEEAKLLIEEYRKIRVAFNDFLKMQTTFFNRKVN